MFYLFIQFYSFIYLIFYLLIIYLFSYLFTYLFVYISVYLYIYLLIYLFIYSSIYLFVNLSIYLLTFIYIFIYPYIYFSIYVFIYLFIYLFIMEGSHVGPAFIDIGREQEEIDKLIDTLLDFKPVKRKNSQVNSSSPGPRSSPLPVAKSIRGRGRPPKTRQSGVSHSPSSVSVADDSASLPAVDLLIECVQKLSNQNKVLLNKVSELESLVRDLSQRKQESVIAENLSTSTRPQDSQVAVSSSILSSVVERVERIEDNFSSRLLICRGPSVSELISSLTESGIADLEKVKGQLCMKICGADITKISVQSIGVSIFGKNRASLKIECNNISVKRHLLEQVKIKKPRGIYVVEYLAPDKRKIYNSLFNLKKRYPAVIKFIYIRGGVIFGKIGEGTLKFESMLDIQAINLQRSPAAVPAAAAAIAAVLPPFRGPAAAAPPPPRVLGTVAASGLAGPRAPAVAAFCLC